MYVKITNGTASEYTIGQLRRDNSNVSFPRQIPDSLLAEYNVYPYTYVSVEYDPLTQVSTPDSFSQDAEGNWVKTFQVSNVDQSVAETNIRQRREDLLKETDYLALSDNTLTSAMSTYRQALRDVTAQSGFPFSVVWPTKPSE